MKPATPLNLPVIEWSPQGVRAWSPVDHQILEVASFADLKGRIQGPVILALARDAAFMKVIGLPEGNDEDLRRILSMQVGNHFPIGGPEAASGFASSGVKGSDGVKTTVGVIAADTLRTILTELNEAGMKSSWTTLTAWGSQAINSEGVIVEALKGRFGIDVIADGRLVLSRVVPATADIASEVQRSQILAGVKGLPTVQAQRDQSPLATLSSMNPSLSIELPEALALKEKAYADKQRSLAVILVGAALVCAAWMGLDRYDAMSRSAQADQKWAAVLKSTGDMAKRSESSATTLSKADAALKLGFEPAQKLSDALVVLSNLAPEGLWLTGVTMERGKPVQVRGTAMKAEQVTVFMRNLNEQKRFADVKLIFSNNGEIEDESVVQFSLNFHLVGNLPLDSEVLKS